MKRLALTAATLVLALSLSLSATARDTQSEIASGETSSSQVAVGKKKATTKVVGKKKTATGSSSAAPKKKSTKSASSKATSSKAAPSKAASSQGAEQNSAIGTWSLNENREGQDYVGTLSVTSKGRVDYLFAMKDSSVGLQLVGEATFSGDEVKLHLWEEKPYEEDGTHVDEPIGISLVTTASLENSKLVLTHKSGDSLGFMLKSGDTMTFNVEKKYKRGYDFFRQ